jgi:acetyl-CoA C-acetyltransferase
MREVAVIGVGMTKFGKSDLTNVEMFSLAGREAFEDAGISPKEIEALVIGNVFASFEEGQANLAPFAAADLGMKNIPATRVEGACASAALAIREAFIWVASGYYDIVMAGGTEKVLAMQTPFATRCFAMGTDSRYESGTGISFPGVFAMVAHRYAYKYGVPLTTLKKSMAQVSVQNHSHALHNPKAQFHKRISVDDVLLSTMIADPLQLYDCCPFTDGAAAIILAPLNLARDLARKPIKIIGIGQGSCGPLYRQKDITRVMAREYSIRNAYKQAGIGPGDVDVCELHDCFTIAQIVATEGLGFFEYGTGYAKVSEGATTFGGSVPINPSGGLKAKGHPIGATGAAQVYEIVKQLREESGARQVKGAKIGLTDTLGGDLMTACNIILEA